MPAADVRYFNGLSVSEVSNFYTQKQEKTPQGGGIIEKKLE
jgi:hypothetical protein